jgi:glycosyltransferase involved in cell wall biosynthesis
VDKLIFDMSDSNKSVILYIITKSELGGAQGNVYDLISSFSKDNEVHLATGSIGPLTEDVAALGVSVHILSNLTRSIKLFGDLNAIQECIALIKTIKPDIIHAHSSKAGVIARVAGSICGVPTIFTAHGWGFTPGTPKRRRIVALLAERLLASLSSKLICVSENDRQLALSRGVGNHKTLGVVRYGIENILVKTPKLTQQPSKLIMVARFNEQKDQTTLLKAISLIKDSYFHLDLVGSGPSFEECKALAASLGIMDKVSFLGDRRDVPDLLAKSQIFILSTHYEGLPISILEAMRAGLPVVATRVNGIPEEVIDGKTGLLVSHEDEQGLANALYKLINNPELRQQMGIAAREKFVQDFTIDRMVVQTQSIYKQIILRNSVSDKVLKHRPKISSPHPSK